MDQKKIISALSVKLGREENDVSELLSGLISVVKTNLENLNTIAIPGFGQLVSTKEDERVGFDEENKRMLYPPRIVVGFEASRVLSSKIAERGGNE